MFESINPELDQITIKHVIEYIAETNSPITYGRLSELVGKTRQHEMSSQGFAGVLGRIQRYCTDLDLPILSIMVVDAKTFHAKEDGFMPAYLELHPLDRDRTFVEIERAEKKRCLNCKDWQRLYDYVGIKEEVPEFRDRFAELNAGEKLTEGTRIFKEIAAEVTTRNREARQRCLAAKGYACTICGKTSEEIYGIEGIIHVHHLNPLAESIGTREVDPIKDLIPVCPNCHAAIHSRKPIYTPEELRKKMGFES